MNSVPFDAARVIRAASTPSMASTERATHLEVRKPSEITLSHAGEIDFEEFLLVIKNMQNPGAVQSKLGVAVQKGVKKGVFQTTMKGGAKALFEGVAGAAKEIPGARRQNLRHAVDDNRREKLREEIKEIDKDVLKYQKVDPKRRMRRAHLNASWAAACRQTFELAKDWGDGVCATEPLLQTLVANPELVEKLGFCSKPKGWAQDAQLYKQYQSMLDIAASYGTLSRAAQDAGLAFDDNDEGTIQSGEFDNQDWSYREFEEAVVRLVRACRGEVAREQAERERYAANAERVSKKKIKPKKGMFGALVARGVD